MSLRHVIHRRLEIFIHELEGPLDLSGDPKLGGAPLRYDSTALREFVRRLNNSPIGFGDLLKQRVVNSEATVTTKLSQLTGSILSKSKFPSNREYRAKMQERIRLSLTSALAQLSGQQPVFSEPVSDYTTDFDQLAQILGRDLKKYLLSPVDALDFSGTVLEAEAILVRRTII